MRPDSGLRRFAITCLRPAAAAGLFAALFVAGAHAGVLPEDESDLMYFRYYGGGVQVQGP